MVPVLVVAGTLLMANLNALVDAVLHPDIAYFDEEHVIVGGITGVCAVVLFFVISAIRQRLADAEAELRALHEVVPICADCKRVRRPEGDPFEQEYWEPIEHVIERMARRHVSHGLCPACIRKNYPNYSGRRPA